MAARLLGPRRCASSSGTWSHLHQPSSPPSACPSQHDSGRDEPVLHRARSASTRHQLGCCSRHRPSGAERGAVAAVSRIAVVSPCWPSTSWAMACATPPTRTHGNPPADPRLSVCRPGRLTAQGQEEPWPVFMRLTKGSEHGQVTFMALAARCSSESPAGHLHLP